jgi:ABC-type nickel/cobalt efflux system permease component RcnA
MCASEHDRHQHEHHHEHHDHDHLHEHDHHHHGVVHRHGLFGRPHSHGPVDGEVSGKGVLALGISGGILPCPSALVVLLSAIALHRVAFGMLLIVAFSFGLALVLTAIGLAMVYAGRLVERIPTGGTAIRLLPVVSAAFVTLLGLGIAVQSLQSTGVFHG